MKKILVLFFIFILSGCIYEWDTHPRFRVRSQSVFCLELDSRYTQCYASAEQCIENERRFSQQVTRQCSSGR